MSVESIFYACHAAKEENGDIWCVDSGSLIIGLVTMNYSDILILPVRQRYALKMALLFNQTKMGSKFIRDYC